MEVLLRATEGDGIEITTDPKSAAVISDVELNSRNRTGLYSDTNELQAAELSLRS
jgi:hypothetical protein